MKPLVSILIPAYNAAPFLADTIKSALAQTWERKEIIIVDDGSKDATVAVAQSFAKDGVKVITQKNAGAAAARNHAYAQSQGDYIQWLDADDLLSPDKITRQMQVAVTAGPRTVLSCGWGFFSHRPQRAKFIPSLLWEDLTPLEWLCRKWEHNLFMQTATWLTSRELSEQAGPWDARMMGDDDGEFFFRVIRGAAGIRFVPDARVYYRISGGNRLSYISRSNKKMDAQFLGMQMQIGYLRALADDARVRATCVTYLQNWLVNFYPERMDLVTASQKLAEEMGGKLQTPELSWKYRWIQKTFGWPAARAAQVNYNEWKAGALRSWDRVMFQIEGGRAD
ncbi:MAG TPA: glycosyltransferase family 2 protein [Verrucomicrobiae bacterium]|nr:glycosyltransferase family 2 protein [Verrucomicrobiae bacterium]